MAPDGSPAGQASASGQPEIVFETKGDEDWPLVRNGAEDVARARLQTRYDAVIQGAREFRDRADTLVDEAFTRPPGELSGFGNIVAAGIECVRLVVPEAGVAAEILEAAHATYEVVRSGWELNEKADEQITANTVEEARKYLHELTKEYAEGIEVSAGRVKQDALDAVGNALDSYIQQNPQPFQLDDDNFYGSLCDGIGIEKADFEKVMMDAWNTVFPPFRQQVLTITARIHFFQELDNDPDRLAFLMDEADKGNDPDALLDLIGGDRAYWDTFLAIYRTLGRNAAAKALAQHLGIPTLAFPGPG